MTEQQLHLLEKLGAYAALKPDVRDAVRAMMAERAGLLAACEVIERWWLDGEIQKHYGAPAWIFMVREAIAKAKGKPGLDSVSQDDKLTT